MTTDDERQKKIDELYAKVEKLEDYERDYKRLKLELSEYAYDFDSSPELDAIDSQLHELQWKVKKEFGIEAVGIEGLRIRYEKEWLALQQERFEQIQQKEPDFQEIFKTAEERQERARGNRENHDHRR